MLHINNNLLFFCFDKNKWNINRTNGNWVFRIAKFFLESPSFVLTDTRITIAEANYYTNVEGYRNVEKEDSYYTNVEGYRNIEKEEVITERQKGEQLNVYLLPSYSTF